MEYKRRIVSFALFGIIVLAGIRCHAATPKPSCGAEQEICDKLLRDVDTLRDPQSGIILAGAPIYLDRFGRDSIIIALELMDYDPGIAKRTLKFWATFQGKKIGPYGEAPGKIPHWKDRAGKQHTVYYSADVTPLYVVLAGEYLKKTGDIDFIRSIWPNISAALGWCRDYGSIRHDLFIEYAPIKDAHDGMVHQGWKDGDSDHLHVRPPVAMVEIQGYYYAALVHGSEMARLLGLLFLAKNYDHRAMLLRKNFLLRFWLPATHRFAFALDGRGRPDARTVSNVGHLLFTGILDGRPDLQEAVVAELFAPDMWTNFGIRTHGTENFDFDVQGYHQGSVWPHDNWMIAQGLRRCGYQAEYDRIKAGVLLAYKGLGGIIPELYAVEKDGTLKPWPRACIPQGWASGALLNFLFEK